MKKLLLALCLKCPWEPVLCQVIVPPSDSLSVSDSEILIIDAIYGNVAQEAEMVADSWVWSSETAEMLNPKEESKLRKQLHSELKRTNQDLHKLYKKAKKENAAAQSDSSLADIVVQDQLASSVPRGRLTAPSPLLRNEIVEAMVERSPHTPLPATASTRTTSKQKSIPFTKKLKRSKTFVNKVAKYSPYAFEAADRSAPCKWIYTSEGVECALSSRTQSAQKKQSSILIDPVENVAVDVASRGAFSPEGESLGKRSDCFDFYKDKRTGVILCVPQGAKQKHYRKQDLYQHGGMRPKYWTSANKVHWKRTATLLQPGGQEEHIVRYPMTTGFPEGSHKKTGPQQATWHYANEHVSLGGQQ